MTRILAGTVEVAPKCALQWQALLSYMRGERALEEIIVREEFAAAEKIAKFIAGNIPTTDATKLDEYYRLLEGVKNRDISGAIKALDDFRTKVVPPMITAVVDCECER